MMKDLIAFTLVATLALGCASSNGSRPSSDLAGKARLKTLLTDKLREQGGDFTSGKLAAADRPRAVNCAIDAMIFDMSDAQANRLADMLEKTIPPEKDFVLYWVNPGDSGHRERAQQVRDRTVEICPDLAPAMNS